MSRKQIGTAQVVVMLVCPVLSLTRASRNGGRCRDMTETIIH